MARQSAKKPAQILRQIEILQGQYERIKQRSSSVISKVRKLVADYDLSVEDVFPSQGAEAEATFAGAAKRQATKAVAPVGKPAGKIAVKYANGAQTWTGRGSRPKWLQEAIAGGAALDDFLVVKGGAKTGAASKGGRKAAVKTAAKSKAKVFPKVAARKAAAIAKGAPAKKAATKKAVKPAAKKAAVKTAAPGDQA